MRLQRAKILLLMMIGLGGCEAPQGGHYNNAVYDAPSYDAVVYMPKYSPDFYDHTHYHDETYAARGVS